MELKDEEPPPFWLQSSTAGRHRRRRHHAASNLFLNTGVLVVFLLAAAVVFLAVVIPSVLSLARQVFNPSLVKSSWNSLNLVLVIFAIVCGFLGRKDENDQTPVNSPMSRETGKSVESSPRQWYGYQDNNNGFGNNVDNVRRLRRNSSSYPDLRQDGPWTVNENRWRFYDDTRVYNSNHQFVRSESRISRSRSMGVIDEDEIEAINIEVDTYTYTSGAKADTLTLRTPPSVTPSPPPSPPRAARKNFRLGDVEDEDQCDTKNIEMNTSEKDQPKVLKSESKPEYLQQPMSPPSPLSPTAYFWPPPSPPPPPPPPPPLRSHSSAVAKNKRNNNQTKRDSRSKVETEIPPSPPAILSQPWTPPSPLSPTSYFWPPPSPPPPPPPPPPQRNNKQNNNQTKRETRSKVETETPPSSPPAILSQPWTPPSPLSPTSYFWPPPSPPPPPPPPPLRTYPTNSTKKKHENKRNTNTNTNTQPNRESKSKIEVQPPPPPPATPPQSKTKVNKSSEDPRDRKGGIVIRTLGRLPRRKRKHSTRRSYENLTEILETPNVSSIHRSKSTPEFPPTSPPRQPPPPPPPPPTSMFQNIFSKKGKSRKKVNVPTPPPPPAKPLHRTKITQQSTRKPAPPAKIDSFRSVDENIGNGSESPLIPIPPPPPPPPYKMPSWKSVMDYVKKESSNISPRSGYSASEDEDSSSSSQKTSKASPLFCPSPDVNTKADDFIARFRAKLTLEKMDSIKLNQGNRLSPLGPDSVRS